ncbi:hypothetical protein AAG565_06505 [Fontimonas sp. SYSU GA230001]
MTDPRTPITPAHLAAHLRSSPRWITGALVVSLAVAQVVQTVAGDLNGLG